MTADNPNRNVAFSNDAIGNISFAAIMTMRLMWITFTSIR